MLPPLKRPLGASIPRTAAAFALVAGLTIVAAACAESEAGPSASTVKIEPSSYVVRAPATTTTTPTVNSADAEGRSPVEQSYVVKSGDYPVKIATLYDISLEELSNFNQWEDDFSDFPSAGDKVRIPPDAKFIDPDAPDTTEAESTDDTDDTNDTEQTTGGRPTTTTSQDRCAPGTYELEPNDYPLGVAEKFDVSVDALNAANADTAGYNTFYPGLEIVIPPPSDC